MANGSMGATLLLIGLTATPLWAQENSKPEVQTPADLVSLGLQDLMKIEVTSVSRRAEQLSDAAASIFVITAEQIRRSGVTNLPDALRLAPNLQVAQVSASGYAISARGFNGSSANKLLVLIDGRSVYTPLFSGVFWDAQDVMLEDVDRIEVISGPGGTLWGVNAVNGVINITTRTAGGTHGGLMVAGTGNRDSRVGARYGGSFAEAGDYRVHATYLHRNHTETEAGVRKQDAQHRSLAGFRADWERPYGQFTVVGAAYKGATGQPEPGSISIAGQRPKLGTILIEGVSLLGSWKRSLSKSSDVTVQAYYDRSERTVPPTFAETLDLVDLQVLYSMRTGRQTFSGGGEYRYGMDHVTNSRYIAFLPGRLNQKWASLFAQDEVTVSNRLRVTAGARFERNDYTGSEVLPNARIAWTAAAGHFFWAAASRTVRAPSRLDRDTFVPGVPPFLLTGGPDVRSETAKVYELGYRGQSADSVTYSVTVYRAAYDHLRTQQVAPNRQSVFFASGMEGTTNGVEMWGAWQVSRAWRLTGGYSGLNESLRLKAGSNDVNAPAAQEGKDPESTWTLRSLFDLPKGMELDVSARRVSALSSPVVPEYLRLDLRLAWQLSRDLEVSVTGQNLFEKHSEFSPLATRSELGRGVFVNVRRHFGGSGS